METTTHENEENQIQNIARNLVGREIHCCASLLISHFANSSESLSGGDYSYEHDLLPILEKPDWSSIDKNSSSAELEYHTALEHWIVTPWLGSILSESGEMVGELFDLHIWGRTTSGQAIYMDSSIQEIAMKTYSKFHENESIPFTK